MKPYKKPKYQLDLRKIEKTIDQQKKEEDWSAEELYQEMLRTKSKYKHR